MQGGVAISFAGAWGGGEPEYPEVGNLNIQVSPGQLKPRGAGGGKKPRRSSSSAPPLSPGRPRLEDSVVLHGLSDPVQVAAYTSVDRGALGSGAGLGAPGHHTSQGSIANQGTPRVTL